MSVKPLLSVENLAVQFDTAHGEITALHDVSFSLAPGEVLGLVTDDLHRVGDGDASFHEDGELTREVHQLLLLDLLLRQLEVERAALLLDLDGIEVLKELKSDERMKFIPIIVLTSSTENPDLEECYRLGANSFGFFAVWCGLKRPQEGELRSSFPAMR